MTMRVADVARAVADCVGRPELLTIEPGDSRDAVVTADVSRLRTEVRGLYVCDASVFPEALARPTVLTILALGRRLARDLLGGVDDVEDDRTARR